MPVAEVHPFMHYIPVACRRLVIGTFPPTKRNWSYDFFYPNRLNLFWRVLADIAGTSLLHFSGVAATAERKKLLDQLYTGITDMGLKILRHNESSLDENLQPVEFMDILALLDKHPGIETLIFTSSSGKSSAAGWFIQYLKQQNLPHKFPGGPRPVHSSIGFRGRTIRLIIVYSPSRRAANRITFESLADMYKLAITDA